MAKLYFRYGTMGSAKTLNLLAVAYNYRQQGKRVVLIKPELDTRFGNELIRSRAGLEQQADILVEAQTSLETGAFEGASCVLVDESHFLSESLVEQLRYVATHLDIPVICYGLRTDFRGRLFEGSKRLLELADSVEEVKTTCTHCNRKAVMNLRHSGGRAILDGPQLELGAEEKYFPVCYSCYEKELMRAGALHENPGRLRGTSAGS